MPLHILSAEESSFYGNSNTYYYLWNDLISEFGSGWNELNIKHLIEICDNLKNVIDKIFASRTAVGDRVKHVPYGDSAISIDLSSFEEKEAIFLIRTYNLVNQALVNKKKVDILIVPNDYNQNHDKLFSLLKANDKAYLVDNLIHEFGSNTTAIIDDFSKLGILEQSENAVLLNSRSKRISFLAGMGSA